MINTKDIVILDFRNGTVKVANVPEKIATDSEKVLEYLYDTYEISESEIEFMIIDEFDTDEIEYL